MFNIFFRSTLNQPGQMPQGAADRRRLMPGLPRQSWLALLPGLLLAGNVAAETAVALQYAGGNGSELNPWLISNLAELRLLSETSADWASGNFFEVTANIDATDTATWNAGAGFSPIGRIGGNAFSGDFDGNGKVIDKLFIDLPAKTQVGMFGGQQGGTVKNIHLTGCSIKGMSQVGGLVGWNRVGSIDSSTVSSCSVTGADGDVGGLVGNLDSGSIISSQTSGVVDAMGSSVGGLVGTTYQATIEQSSSSSDVTGASEVGGLIGYFNQSSMASDSASGNVQGTDNVGGLIGKLNSPAAPLNLSHATGTVTGSGDSVGGLIGYTQFGNVTNNYATGQVIGTGSPKKMGGLIGQAIGTTTQDSYATGNVSGIESVGGLIGEANGGSISRCYATGQIAQTSADSSLGFFGGLVGFADGIITSSSASGGVSAPDFDNVGGLVGTLGSGAEINSSYANGGVDGSDRVGGLFGYCGGSSFVTSSYAMGVVTGVGTDVGALVGSHINCLLAGLPSYWLDPDGATVGIGFGSAGGAKGLTEAEMLMQSKFVGFDFIDTWYIVEGVQRPSLLWQRPPELMFFSGFESSL